MSTNTNTYNVRVQLAKRQTGTEYDVTVKLNDAADSEERVGGAFRACYDMEILRGSVKRLPDGGAVYCFLLDQERGDEWRQRLTLAVFPLNQN